MSHYPHCEGSMRVVCGFFKEWISWSQIHSRIGNRILKIGEKLPALHRLAQEFAMECRLSCPVSPRKRRRVFRDGSTPRAPPTYGFEVSVRNGAVGRPAAL